MNNIVAYTYRIKCKVTGKSYYGIKYSRDCNTSDLWNTYFTSSKYVHELIKKYGKYSFLVEIRKTFSDIEKARKWESEVLRRLKVRNNDNWINCHDNTSFPIMIGENNPMFGQKRNFDYNWRYKLGSSKRGKKLSEDEKKKLSISHRKMWNNYTQEEKERRVKHLKNKDFEEKRLNSIKESNSVKKSKKWKLFFPNNEHIIIKNLKKYCEENNLPYRNIVSTKGKRKTVDGYSAILL